MGVYYKNNMLIGQVEGLSFGGCYDQPFISVDTQLTCTQTFLILYKAETKESHFDWEGEGLPFGGCYEQPLKAKDFH